PHLCRRRRPAVRDRQPARRPGRGVRRSGPARPRVPPAACRPSRRAGRAGCVAVHGPPGRRPLARASRPLAPKSTAMVRAAARLPYDARMAGLPYVDLESAPEKVRETMERLPVKLNVFWMMANADTCFRPLLQLGSAILGRLALPARLRELLILQVGKG